jgi:hypothetical protein
MNLEITKSRKIALLLAIISCITLTQNIGSATISGVDLDIQTIKFEHNPVIDQMVHFTIFVKNKGTEATQFLSVEFDFGNGVGGGFGGPIVIEPGETKVFTSGTTYSESRKYIVRASVNTPRDVNLKNNYETVVINIK